MAVHRQCNASEHTRAHHRLCQPRTDEQHAVALPQSFGVTTTKIPGRDFFRRTYPLLDTTVATRHLTAQSPTMSPQIPDLDVQSKNARRALRPVGALTAERV